MTTMLNMLTMDSMIMMTSVLIETIEGLNATSVDMNKLTRNMNMGESNAVRIAAVVVTRSKGRTQQ